MLDGEHPGHRKKRFMSDLKDSSTSSQPISCVHREMFPTYFRHNHSLNSIPSAHCHVGWLLHSQWHGSPPWLRSTRCRSGPIQPVCAWRIRYERMQVHHGILQQWNHTTYKPQFTNFLYYRTRWLGLLTASQNIQDMAKWIVNRELYLALTLCWLDHEGAWHWPWHGRGMVTIIHQPLRHILCLNSCRFLQDPQ